MLRVALHKCRVQGATNGDELGSQIGENALEDIWNPLVENTINGRRD